MADEADDARRKSAVLLDARIAEIRARAQEPVAVATGYCLYCGDDDMAPGQRWCDANCCRDWERENEH